MWLRDDLPLDIPSARILIYGYDTRTIRNNSNQNLTDLGRAFQLDIMGIRVCLTYVLQIHVAIVNLVSSKPINTVQ